MVLEVGVWKGNLAEHLLKSCTSIERYYMLDPWRNQPMWNKPWNVSSEDFDSVFEEAMGRTEFAKDRRRILRGTTLEKIDQIADREIDLVYIDGDHTLRGTTIDLIRTFPKVADGGYLGGDDFLPSIWQHPAPFEPTLVFPFAVHFAVAVQCPIVALPFNQFAIIKDFSGFQFMDRHGRYRQIGLRAQVDRLPLAQRLKGKLTRFPPQISRRLVSLVLACCRF